MINFASLFNQFRSSSNNAVNEILQQKDVTLSSLIDEDSFINQYKTGNNKLLEFMKYDKVKQLVDYITVLGPQDDKKRSYKFPLAAADVLSADIPSIQNFFLPEDKIYDEKVTYEEQLVEEQVDLNEANRQEQDKEGQKGSIDKQKTVISDSLEASEQDQPAYKDEQTSTTQQEKTKPESEETFPEQQNKQKITVQKIHRIEKVQKIQFPALINHLFAYFDQEIYYILTGYVCRVLTSLFNKKSSKVFIHQRKMMEFLFADTKITKMVKHIESRSVGEFLLKVLTLQSSDWIKQRTQLFTFLLQKLEQNNSIHVLSNFSTFISETIEKAAANAKSQNPIPEFASIFFNPEVVTIVIKNVMSDYQNVSVYNAAILLTYLTNVPLTLPKDQNMIQQFKELLETFIDKSLQKLNVTSKDRPKLGFGRIKMIQILGFILKENLLKAREMFASRDQAYQTLFNLCRNYEMNNVLHNQIVKLISLSFSDSSLSQALLKNDVLLSFLLTEAEQDLKIREGKGQQKYRKGYIGHVVQMARLVQQHAAKDNQAAIKIYESDAFERILSILVDKQVSEGNKNLAGFSIKRQLKNEIMFQKQDIITHYIDFLAHSPKPVFDPEPIQVNIEHPDFLQEMQRQIEQNLSLEQQSKKQQTKVEQTGNLIRKVEDGSQTPPLETIEVIETQINMEINFFKGHLDYNVDELLEEL